MCSKFKKWKTLNLVKPTARYSLIMQKAENKSTLDQVLNYDNIIDNVPQKFNQRRKWLISSIFIKKYMNNRPLRHWI